MAQAGHSSSPIGSPQCAEKSSMEAAEEERRRGITRKMKEIMSDTTLTGAEKSRMCQELLVRRPAVQPESDEKAATDQAVPDTFKCATCHDWLDRPVTMPCQHNFCLACVKGLDRGNNQQCPTCRAPISKNSIRNARVNTALNVAIRVAKNPTQASTSTAAAKAHERVGNDQRPDEAYVTERAQRAGRANMASGRIMVTTNNEHFGPITAAHDPSRNRGVLVGDTWEDRLTCRQWGAHFPHVAGIAGQSDNGAQSIVLAGGYEDDLDIGEYILYTGSGGRDLSGNKRTNKEQSFDQEFTLMNEALRVSCTRGLPVRVVRSHKEKSFYAPKDKGVRYDGVYRIVACWRKPGIQKHLVCRFLLTRCDNEPAPWSSETNGDPERSDKDIPAEAVEEMKQAAGQIQRMDKSPYWSFDTAQQKWGWARESPTLHAKARGSNKPRDPTKALRARLTEQEKALKEFSCLLCKDVMKDPVRTPCGHNFCKSCLDNKFEGIGDILAPNAARSLRIRKTIKKCPGCPADICAFLSTAQVNRDMRNAIEELQASVAAEQVKIAAALAALPSTSGGGADDDGEGVDEDEGADLEPAVEAEGDGSSDEEEIKEEAVKQEVKAEVKEEAINEVKAEAVKEEVKEEAVKEEVKEESNEAGPSQPPAKRSRRK